MIKRIKIYSLLIFLLFSAFYSTGYSQIFPFENFGTVEGLPQSSVTCIAQDSAGYLWIGTWQGVSRFDGSCFNNDCLGSGIPGNVIISIAFDKGGNLWMGTRKSGVGKYSGTGWTYFNEESGISGSVYTRVLPASDGRVWFYTYDGGISVLDGKDWVYYNTREGFIGDYVVRMYEDRDKNIWACTMSGLARFDGKEWKYWTTGDGLPDNQVLSVMQDRAGNVWVGTIAGLYVFEKGDPDKGHLVKEAGERVFSCMLEDRQSNIWFGTINGLLKYDRDGWQLYAETNGLEENKITSLLEDREGNIWIGHLSSGLSKFTNHAIRYYDRKNGLVSNHVRAFEEDSKGNIWIGTHTNGLSVLTGKGWQYPGGYDGQLRERTVLDLLIEKAGRVLVGTFYGVYVIDGKNNYLLGNSESGLVDNDCYGLYQTRDGQILVFTTSGVFSLENERFERFSLGQFGDPPVAMFGAIEDRLGNLWINSQFDGLYVRRDGNWENITREDGLAGNSTNSMSMDSTGNLWFTSIDNGVAVYDGEKFRTYNKEDGLLDNFTNFAVHTAEYSFIGTNQGVSIFDGDKFTSLTAADGLPSNETNRNAAMIDSKGNLWFGTTSGAVCFDPDQYIVRKVQPIVKIDRVCEFNGKSIAEGARLHHSIQFLSFNYSSIHFSYPEGIEYSVRLRGLSDSWQKVTTTTQQYVNLPHGEYEFQVKALTAGGVWSEEPATFNFKILAPFWMEWWFILLAGTAMLSFAWLIINFIYRHNKEKALSAKNKDLEQAIYNMNREVDVRLSVENALRLNENRYRILFERLHDAAFVADVETGILVQANQQAEVLTGYTRNELIGMHQKNLHPSDIDYEKKFRKNLSASEFDTIDAEIQTKDGKIMPVQILSSIIELDGTKKAVGLFRNITVQKENEHDKLLDDKRLNAQLKLFQMYEKPIDEILNYALNIAVEITESKVGFLGFMNDDETVLNFHSWSDTGIEDCKIQDSPICFCITDSGLWSKAITKKEAVIVNDYSADIDGKKGMPDDHLPLHNFIGVPLIQDGKVVCLVSVANKNEDYTDFDTRQVNLLLEAMWQLYKRKLVENELRYNETMLRTVFENVPVSIIILDKDGVVEYINKALPGIYQAEIVGRKIASLCCREYQDKFENSIKDVLENAENKSFELETESSEGDTRNISIVLSPARRHNEIDSIIMVASDITARKKLEKETYKAGKLESISILAGGISHDFNNILTAILGNISLAKLLSNSSEEIVEILSEAEKASLRAKDLTRQLLTFSKGGETIRRITSLKDLISTSASFALRGTNSSFNLNMDDDLWSISADENQINQVISNLVSNAQQSMPDGGTVEIFAENVKFPGDKEPQLNDDRYVKIMVADKGNGISSEDLPKIFDPYYTTKDSGSGLGLSITYNIVHKHGGYISVDSKPGEGTRMTVYLPVARDNRIIKAADSGPVREKSMAGRRLLVLEDEEFVGRVVKRILEEFGCVVDVARTGNEAIDRYIESIEQGDKYEVVIVDLAIKGGMDGSQAMKELVEIDPDIVAIVSSAYTDEQTVTDYASYGFKAAVTKPYIVDELKLALQRVIHS